MARSTQVATQYIEENFLYLSKDKYNSLGLFDLIYCTGVIYHNAEQLRLLRKLYQLLNPSGYLVLESATLRNPRWLRSGNYVQIHYPKTFRDTHTITHLPTSGAIKAWLTMVGFSKIIDVQCYDKDNRNLRGQRYACIAVKGLKDNGGVYHEKTGLNPPYTFGDAS